MNVSILKALRTLAESTGDAPGIYEGVDAIRGDVESFFAGEGEVLTGNYERAVEHFKRHPDTIEDFMERFNKSEEEARAILEG